MKKILFLFIFSLIFLNGCNFSENKAKEKSCLDSGGKVTTSICCEGVKGFPNDCLIGACGCPPEYSHDVPSCACPEDKCFNGTGCVEFTIDQKGK